MKKDLVFAPLLVIVGILLFLLKATGMIAHIAISVVGIVLLIVYTVLTRKEWVWPLLEVQTRIFYGIALITGVILMNVHGVVVLSILHKVSAALFVLMIIGSLIHKLTVAKKK